MLQVGPCEENGSNAKELMVQATALLHLAGKGDSRAGPGSPRQVCSWRSRLLLGPSEAWKPPWRRGSEREGPPRAETVQAGASPRLEPAPPRPGSCQGVS